ncbi:MAG: murein biosynthesis integral membrane protein MurJ [Chloroflexi bacterium]|nr:murein biosynthesis integral membrane protein MurJ [Chloroflexota bacterium]
MNHIARSSLIIAFFFGIDKILGFVRQLIVARQFQLSYELDVFNAANNIPDLLSALISGGALGIALIPVLSEYLQTRARKDAWALFSQIINLAFLVTAGLSLIIVFLAPWLMEHVIAPGFPPEQKLQAVKLMRLDLIAILIFSLSGLIMAGLQANQHFLLPALAPALYNIGQIFGASILAPQQGYQLGPITLPAMGMGIEGLVYGVIIGAILHLLIQIPGLIKYEFKWRPGINFKDAGVRQVLNLLGPRVLTMFFIQLFFIVRDNLASRLGEGSVTALNLGWFIMQVPETLLGTAFAIALLPTISEMFARGEMDRFKTSINSAVRTMIALTIPTAMILAVVIKPLVKLAFDYDDAGTDMIVLATRIYLAGLAGHALLEIASRTFYAQKNAKIPLIAAAINALMYIVLAVTLMKVLGFAGIATANSISFTMEALLLLYLLNRKYPGVLKVRKTLLRVVIGGGLAGIISFLILRLPYNSFYLSLAGIAAGALICIPFIMPEIRLLLSLGGVERSLNAN